MQPVKAGSAVSYTRIVPATKDEPQHHETIDAILIRYDVDSDPEKVPNAHLAFVDPKSHRHLKDSNWADAFQDVGGVPYEPEGEFYHGWTERDESRDNLLRQLVAADAKMEDLEARIKELSAENLVLKEKAEPVDDDHLVRESTVVNAPPSVPEESATEKSSKIRVIKGK